MSPRPRKTRPKTPVRSRQLRTASHDQRETLCPWKPPERRREDWLKGYCEWGDVTTPAPESLLRRQREREEEEEEGEDVDAACGGSRDFAATCSCARFITRLSGISQGRRA